MVNLRSAQVLLVAATVVAVAGCPDWKIDTPLETKITRIAAFYCIQPNVETCQGRGEEIPAGTLPPTDRAFQVWAWHPGANTTSWRLLWDSGFSENQIKLAVDSVGQSVNLQSFIAQSGFKKVWVRAAIIGVNGADTVALDRDSIGWTFP
jgi:hypothetical protein